MLIDHKELAQTIDKLPAFPESVSKILELTAKKDLAPNELVAVVERDMVMTLRVLKLVNSPLFGLVREVTSVQHAVVYVGIDVIKNLAISIATSGTLPKNNSAGLDMDAFWLQSLSVGVAAKLIAETKGISKFESADYFVAGLLHNIGKIVFAHFYPDNYAKVLETAKLMDKADHVVEQELFGIDHCELGAMLAEEWQLPARLVEAIKNHHALSAESIASQNDSDIAKAIFCGSQIFHRLNADLRERSAVPKSIQSWLGQSIDETIESLENLEEEIDKAMVFIQQ